jgi:hypothetical protein
MAFASKNHFKQPEKKHGESRETEIVKKEQPKSCNLPFQGI